MNYFAWTGLINSVVATLGGAIVFFQNPRDKRNIVATLWFMSIGWWMLGYCLWQISTNETQALFWTRFLMMGSLMIPVFSYHTSLIMYRLGSPARTLLLWISYVATVVAMVSNLTPYFISHVERQMFFPFWPMPGPFFHIFTVLVVFLSLKSIQLLLEYREKASPLMRNEMLWFTIAIACGYGGGGLNLFPWYKIPIPPVLNFGVTIYIVLTILMFFRLGLLDVRLFFRDTTVHIITSIIVGSALGSISYLFIGNLHMIWIGICMLLSVPVLYQPTFNLTQRIIKQTRLGRVDTYLSSIDSKLGFLRESSFSYDSLANNLTQAVMGTFPVKMVSTYFWDEPSKSFHLRAQIGMSTPLAADLKFNRSELSVREDNPLVTFLMRQQKYVSREVLEAEGSNHTNTNVLLAMRRMEAEICLPFFLLGRVRGLLVIGAKKDKGIFHKQDVNALELYQRIGEDIMRYIYGMEHEIRHAALYSHDMNNDTKALVQALQFLNSPLSKNVPDDRLSKIIKQAEDVATRLNQSFQLNRDRSALILKSIRGEYVTDNQNLVDLIKESFGKFILRADEQKISYRCILPDLSCRVLANASDTIRVMDNLLSNAFRYVNENGEIKVELTIKNEHACVAISDTGTGIKPDIIEHIWDFGWQVKDSKQGASGLGLALVKQIIDMHNWKISVGKNPDGSGTRFAIEMPLAHALKDENSPPNQRAA
jgi:signal transduction histidine kinase